MISPYEYYSDTLGVQARFLFDGSNAHEKSLCLIGERGLQMRIKRKSMYRLRNNAPGMPMLINWATLPDSWKGLLVKTFGEPTKQIKQTWFEKLYERDMKAFDFYTTYLFPDNSTLDDDKIEEYTVNASVLNTIAKIYDKRRDIRKQMRLEVSDIWSIITAESNRFRDKQVKAHTLPDSVSRLREKLNKYKKEGYGYLISKKHKNANARIVTDDIEIFLNCLFADYEYKPTMSDVASQYDAFLAGYVEVINNVSGEIYDPKGFCKLSTGTIRNYLSKWDNIIATHNIRGGDRQKLMARFKPYHSLEQPKHAGSIISIDDRNPIFEYEDGKRVWFYNGIDLGSEAFTCWVWGKSKDGIILDFYRQMVRNYAEWGLNLPAELEGELNLNASFKDTFLQEGSMFQYVRIEANNARGKRIEQYYRPLRYQYEKKREGWLARPFALIESNQAGPEKKKIIPYDDIVKGCLRDIENWNNTEHSQIKGKTRWEVFLSTQHPNLRPTNYRAIIPMLGYKTQTSCHTGIIKLQKQEFLLGNNGVIAVGSTLIDLMVQVEGRDVDVYWLDGNDEAVLKAYVYIGDRLICEAISKPTYNRARIEQTPEDMANRELMSKYVSTIDGFGRRQRKALDKVTVIDNRTTTLNNTFRMPGITKREITEYVEAEILPDVNEEYELELNTVETGFNSSLKNRF